MPEYVYRTRDAEGALLTGNIVAESYEAALRNLHDRDQHVIDLRDRTSSRALSLGNLFGRQRVSVADQASITRQLADLIGAGVTVVESLQLVSRGNFPNSLQKRLERLSSAIETGNSLSSALEADAGLLPREIVATVKAGESSGALAQVLESSAALLDRQAELVGQIQRSLTYPAIVATASLITVGVMFGFLLPRMGVLYADFDQELPIPTRVLLFLGNAVSNSAWFLLPALALLVVGGIILAQRDPRRLRAFALTVAAHGALGRILQLNDQVRFARTLSMLLQGGVAADTALGLCGDVLISPTGSAEVHELRTRIEAGSSLAQAFEQSGYFGGALATVVRVGENSGTTPTALSRAADHLDRDLQGRLKRFTTILEPAIIAILALVVGAIVFSMMLPILELDLLVS